MNYTFVIADNQALTRCGLRRLINTVTVEAAIVEVSEKKTLIDTLSSIAVNAGVVVILDYTLFDIRGVGELLVITRRFSQVNWIMLSESLSVNFIRCVCAEDNVSVALKDSSLEELLLTFTRSLAGRKYICKHINDILNSRASIDEKRETLSSTETEILRYLALGRSPKEIAVLRNSSLHTIITHKKNIFRKLGINTVYEAIKYALRSGLIEQAEYYI